MIDNPINPFCSEKLEPINTRLRIPNHPILNNAGKWSKSLRLLSEPEIPETVDELKVRLREQALVQNELWNLLSEMRAENQALTQDKEQLSNAVAEKEREVTILTERIQNDQLQITEITASLDQLKVCKEADKEVEMMVQKLNAEMNRLLSENGLLQCQVATLARENTAIRWNMANTVGQMRNTLDHTIKQNEMCANDSYRKILELNETVKRKRTELAELELRRRVNDDRVTNMLKDKNLEAGKLVRDTTRRLKKTSIDLAPLKSLKIIDNLHLPTLDRELEYLTYNMETMMTLIKLLTEKYSNDLNDTLNETCQEDLDSSFNDISSIVKDTLDDILARTKRPVGQFRYSNRLDVELGDFRNMALNKMEEKFAILSMNLTIDLTTYKKRMDIKREHYVQLTWAFFQHLINILKLAMSSKDPFRSQDNLKSLVHSVSHLKNTAVEVFDAAEEFGELQYEYRNIKCWRFVTNYVATLSKQLKDK